jgi:RNA polymerase sigma-70 factor (ECF subfamily)
MLSGGKRESDLAQVESNSSGQGASDPKAEAALEGRPTAEGGTDEALLEEAARGSAEAFEALVLRYQDRVYNLLMRFCGTAEEAEDLAQEASLKAYRALGSFRHGSRFYTWLFRIAVNTALTRRRKEVRRRGHEVASLDAPASAGSEEEVLRAAVADEASTDPAEEMEKEHVRARVREALEDVDEDYRTVLLLRDMEGMDYDAIGETLNITRAAVKSRLHRARQEMARLLKDLRPA